MRIYVTVDAFIFFDTEPFDLWECWTVPSLAMNTGNFWQLCWIRTKTGDPWERLLQHVCSCCEQPMRVCACLPVLCFSLCSNVTERAEVWWKHVVASWGAAQGGKKPTGMEKNNTSPVKCQPVFSPLEKVNADIKELIKTWLKSVRFFHSLWAGHLFKEVNVL